VELAQYGVQWVEFGGSDVENLGKLLVTLLVSFIILFYFILFYWRSVFISLRDGVHYEVIRRCSRQRAAEHTWEQ
jgi:hypothetical protein